MSVDFNQGFEAGLRSCQLQMEERIARLEAENYRLTQGILTVAKMCDNCNTLYDGQMQLYDLLKGAEVKGGCDACWVDSLQDKLDKAKKVIEALRLALEPFAAVGRQTQDDLEDYLCHHHDHFLGHYRAAVAAMEVSEHEGLGITSAGSGVRETGFEEARRAVGGGAGCFKEC